MFINLEVEDGSKMRAYVASPEGQPSKAIIVFQEAYGVNPYIRSIVDLFAQQGFLAIAPELFHRTAGDGFEAAYGDMTAIGPHFQAITVEGLLADAKAAHAWLASQNVSTEEISSVGFCLGGRVSYVANSLLPLKRAISFYGGGIHTLPELAAKQHAPILFLWGGLDKHILPEHRRAAVDAMTTSGKSFTEILFSDAEHGFFCDARDSYHPRSAKLAWQLVLEFLK